MPDKADTILNLAIGIGVVAIVITFLWPRQGLFARVRRFWLAGQRVLIRR